MRLADLAPQWWADSADRQGQGLSFLCPHCGSAYRIAVALCNPLDGSSMSQHAKVVYKRRGSTFEELSIEPRIYVPGHARVRIANGEVAWEAGDI